MKEQRKPTWDFCARVAQAFGEAPEHVFRIANLLPAIPPDESIERRVLYFLRKLAPENQNVVVRIMRILVGQRVAVAQSAATDQPLTEDEQEALHILCNLEPVEQEPVIRMLRGLAKPDITGDLEILTTSPEERKVLLAFRGLQATDRETITRMLDALAGQTDRGEP